MLLLLMLLLLLVVLLVVLLLVVFLLLVLLVVFLLLLLLLFVLLAVYTETAVGSTAANVAIKAIASAQIPLCLPPTLVMQMEGSLKEELPILPFNFACSYQRLNQDSDLAEICHEC